MNLLDKKHGMVAMMLLSLFFVSCEDPGKIGLNVDPKNGALLAKYKEFVLPSTQVQFNPRSTVNSSYIQAGSYTEPNFGIISSKTYTWLGVQPTVPEVSPTAVYDEISISLKFSSAYGTEVSNGEIETLDLYQLDQAIEPGSDYTRIDERNLGPYIGSLDLYLQESDTLQTDSLFTFGLSDSFGQALFDKLKLNDGTYDNDTSFNALFKGIAFVPGAANDKIIQLALSTISVKLAYHEFNLSGEQVDRVYNFDIGSMRFYNITSELGGTPLSGIQPNNEEFLPSSDNRFLQSGTLIGLKLDYSAFNQFADTIDNMVVQRAMLKVGGLKENQAGTTNPFSLKGYFTDENNKWPATTDQPSGADTLDVFVLLQDDLFNSNLIPPGIYLSGQDIFLGNKNDSTSYVATMSSFLQYTYTDAFASEETPLEQRGELILMPPSDIAFPQSSPSHVLTNHFAVHKDSIRLEVHYTVPN